MKSLFAVFLVCSLGICLFAQPVIRTTNGVLNAASYAQQGMPNSSIAQGSTFTIFAEDPSTGPLGPAALQEVTSFPVSTTLGDTSVNVTAGGKTVQAPMIFTIANQVAAVMPSTTPVGNATVSVTYKGATSAEYPIQVVASSFGTFAVNVQGNGTGDVTDIKYNKFLPNSAALADDVAIIWGTGLGPVPYPDADQPKATNLTSIPVKLYIGGQLVSTSYQGPSGCCAGLNQIVFTVPKGITGCSVPVEVSINNIVSPTTTMPIASSENRVCSDPNGIPSSVLQTLLSKSSFNLGFVSLSRLPETILGLGTTTADTGIAGFFNVKPLQFAGATIFQTAAIGSCIVNAFSESAEANLLSAFTGLDAGPFIDVNGPGGTQELAPVQGVLGVYESTNGTTFLTPGSYTATGSGGATVGKFSVGMTVANPITWTNETSISTVDRASGVTVIWTGGAPGTYATITGSSISIGPPTVVATFTCQAPIAQQTFTVGPDVLLQLPASIGALSVGNNEPYTEFTATGLDYGFAESSVQISESVTYQ